MISSGVLPSETRLRQARHLTGKCFDRLVVSGTGTWTAIEILKPPYGKRPNDANKRVWTDHFFVGATLREE